MMRRRSSRLGLGTLLLAAIATTGVVASDASADAPHARTRETIVDPASTGVVVYHWQKTVSPDGAMSERVLVQTVMDDLEAGRITLDLDTLIDSEGRRYELAADAFQERDEDPVTYAIKLTRYSPKHLDEAGIEQAWKDAHPNGTLRDLEAFRARRAAPREAPKTETVVTSDVLDWLASARRGDALDVMIKLQETEGALALPKVAASLFRTEPAFALAQMKARLLRIEERKNQLETLQAPVIRDITSAGATLLKTNWLINGIQARVTPQALAKLAKDPRVLRVERLEDSIPDTNNLDDMREATQVVQLHDDGSDGETSSGRSAVGDIFLAIIDDSVDADHPAWDDWSGGPSRLTDVWRESAGVWGTVAVSATTTPSHGTKVAGIAMADLMQGQDSAITLTGDQDDRTGFAPEASFAFIESSGGTVDSIEQAIDLSVDIINYSASNNYNCDLSHTSNDAVDEAMLDGIFFAKSSGSNGTPGAGCNIGTPGAASGAFSVTATDRSAVPLNTGTVSSGSSHGPDANGRAVVAMAACGGPEGNTDAAVDDTYGAFGATSSAAPVVAGAAAALKDHLLDVFSSAIVNEVGFFYATMLVMGDGQMDSGVAMAQEEMDGVWGAGRLRTRMFNAAGMDTPWRARLISRTIEDGETNSDLYLNPDASNVNQPLSSDVERIRAAVFWHEPNIEDSVGNWATISSTICNSVGFCYGSGNSGDPRQRLRIGNVAGGKTWWIKLTGVDVPASNDSNYHYLQDERKVYVAVYWEDEDRDDGDGPDASIQ